MNKCKVHNRWNSRGQCMDCKLAASKRAYHKKRKLIVRYKMFCGCQLCGYKKNPYALQLDHINPALKSERLKMKGRNRGFETLPWGALQEEIRKCRVLCANCHAEETHGEYTSNEAISPR